MNLDLHSTSSGITLHHQTSVNVLGSVRILGEGWFSNEENHCVEMVVGLESLPANITIDNPMWAIVGGETHVVDDPMNITIESPEIVCVEPMEGAIQLAETSLDGRISGPVINYQSDDGTSFTLTASLLDINRTAIALEDGFEFTNSNPFDAVALGWHLNQSSACPEFVTTELSENSNHTFDENFNGSQVIHISDETMNGILSIPDFGILTVCDGSLRFIYQMISGPSILVN